MTLGNFFHLVGHVFCFFFSAVLQPVVILCISDLLINPHMHFCSNQCAIVTSRAPFPLNGGMCRALCQVVQRLSTDAGRELAERLPRREIGDQLTPPRGVSAEAKKAPRSFVGCEPCHAMPRQSTRDFRSFSSRLVRCPVRRMLRAESLCEPCDSHGSWHQTPAHQERMSWERRAYGCGSNICTHFWNPGKWNQRLKHAVPWWCNFDPYPYTSNGHTGKHFGGPFWYRFFEPQPYVSGSWSGIEEPTCDPGAR